MTFLHFDSFAVKNINIFSFRFHVKHTRNFQIKKISFPNIFFIPNVVIKSDSFFYLFKNIDIRDGTYTQQIFDILNFPRVGRKHAYI